MLAKRPKVRSLSNALVSALGLAFLSTAGVAAGQGRDLACSSDQISSAPGTTTFDAHGTTTFSSAQVSSTEPGNLGGGKLTYSLTGQIVGPNTGPSDGDILGVLDFTIDWDAFRPDTEFHSICVEEVDARFKNLFIANQGTISGSPFATSGSVPRGTSTQQGFAQINLHRVHAKVADLLLLMHFGNVCFGIPPALVIDRPSAQALGSKTGNAGRRQACD